MMSAYANSVQKPERFDLYVRKFRSICMMHGVPMGSLKELPVFLRKLIDDRHLAMDFWGFIGKLSDREGGVLSDDQILGVIVEGITDCDIAEQDGGAQRTVGDLRAMLAGVDIQGPQYGQVEMAPFPKSDAAAQKVEKQFDTWAAEKQQPDEKASDKPLDGELRAHGEVLGARLSDSQSPTPPPDVRVPLPVEKQAASAPAGDRTASAPSGERTVSVPEWRGSSESPKKLDEELHRAAVLPTTPAPQLDEALLRLELTKLVQQYFDNIDKRISKLEPPVEGAIAPPVTRRSLEEPISEDEIEELRLRRMGRTRLVLEPAAAPVEPPLQVPERVEPVKAEDDDVPMRVPLEHYSPPPIYGRAPFLLMLVLIGSGFAIYRDPTLLRKGISFVARQFHTDARVASSNRDSTAAPASAPASPTTTQPSQPSVVESVLQGTSTPPQAPAPEQSDSSPASQSAGPAQTAANDAASGSGQKTVTDRAVAQTQQAIADTISSIESAGAIRVNPSVMDENLIVQRVPAYPEAAKLSGVQGDVVMQALISKEGTVKRVHVVEGDSRLRTAAEEAVYKWRYRPYVLHGQPVEVATTVTVNFNLDRR
jgi:TonB family protein